MDWLTLHELNFPCFLMAKFKKILLMLFLYAAFANAQEITMEYTLDYINSKLGPCCSIEVKKGILTAVYHEKGQLVREDNVNIADLDISSIRYDDINKMLVINCKGAPAKKCVNRDIPAYGSKGVYRPYARISWEVYLVPEKAAALEKAFAFMIRKVLDPKYNVNTPFE
jgi:hypothetical protein